MPLKLPAFLEKPIQDRTRMPWGKHKGKKIVELPNRHILWLMGMLTSFRLKWLQEAIYNEYIKRLTEDL